MMKIVHPFFFFSLLAVLITACNKHTDPGPQSFFVKLFPTDSSYKTGGSFQVDDGNYIIYGFDPDNGGVLPIVIKTDQSGTIKWQIKLSPLFHYLTIKHIPGGDMIAVGVENIEAKNLNVCKIDQETGDITAVWDYEIDSVKVNKDYLPDFVEKDGSLIISGYGIDNSGANLRAQPFILHIDQSGNQIALKKYKLDSHVTFLTTSICSNGDGYSVCGTANNPNLTYKGLFYMEADDSLNLVSDTVLLDSTKSISAAVMIEHIPDSSPIIFGSEGGLNLAGTLFRIKVDESGTLGSRFFYYDYENFGRFTKISRTTDGGYILSATVNKTDGGVFVSYTKIYLMKLGPDMHVQWSKQFDSSNPYTSVSVTQTTDGGYLVSGYEHTASYVFTMVMIKTDASGNVVPVL